MFLFYPYKLKEKVVAEKICWHQMKPDTKVRADFFLTNLRKLMRNINILILFCFVLEASSAPGAKPDTDTWNQWRGPNRDGIVTGKPWPADLKDEHFKLKWRVELGSSYSGAILDNNTVYVTESKGSNEVVRALDRKSGTEKWKQMWAGKMSVPFFARSNGSWIRSTPALANGKLFVAGIRDHLVCLDAKSGKKLWEIDFPKELKTPIPTFGCVCSPMVDGKFVYMQAGAGFCKIEQDSGKILWRTMKDKGGMYGSAFSSPVIATLGGQRQILVQSRAELAGVDIKSGEVLWRQQVKAFRGMNILTPLPYKQGIYTSTYGGRSHYYDIKRDKSWESVEKWENKAQAYMCSPILFGDHVYLHLRNQRFACYNITSGKEAWVSSERFGKYMSLVRQGEKILALDQNGTLYLIRANPKKLEIVDSRKISKQQTWAHLAVSGEQIAVRELNAITFYDWKRTKAVIP